MDSSIVHFKEAIAALRQRAVMRGHQQGYAFRGGQIEQQIKDCCAGFFIERSSGFVCQQNLRTVHQSAAESGALALTAGELLNAVTKAVAEAGSLSELLEPFARRTAIRACGHAGNHAVLLEGEIGDEVMQLKHKADLVPQKTKQVAPAINLRAVHGYMAAVGRIEAAKQVQQRAFAATGWAAKRNGLALQDIEANAFEHGDGAVVIALP
jgi:hypothetical protein